ncbi:MAG: glycine cleavage system protein GcvH [Legionellaceae bacterium]|nr:glycine cleavage system protein GcvH [Legionellaceae bacterium]
MSYLRYTSSHEWLNTEQDDMVVGITDHAQHLLGDLVYIELPTVGKEVAAGDEIGVLESVKAASDFYAPISGTVVAVNEQVEKNPAILNQDPFGLGWLVKIKPQQKERALEEISTLLKEDQYLSELTEDI